MVAATTTITLAVPTSFTIDPARLVAWLLSKGYSEIPGSAGAMYRFFKRGNQIADMPRHPEWCDYARYLQDAVIHAADNEGLEPAALAALLAPPTDGPALQWQHASAGTRAPVLALLDRESRFERSDATRCRNNCEPELALAAEGRALGLEAAAAVLRGGAHG